SQSDQAQAHDQQARRQAEARTAAAGDRAAGAALAGVARSIAVGVGLIGVRTVVAVVVAVGDAVGVVVRVRRAAAAGPRSALQRIVRAAVGAVIDEVVVAVAIGNP